MKYRISSDWHLEILESGNVDRALNIVNTYILPPMPDDKEQVLLLAGDICNYHRREYLAPVLKSLSERFLEVYYIPGNHEYYNGNFQDVDILIPELIEDLPNVRFGSQMIYGIDDRKLLCTTLWTSFNNRDPDIMRLCQYMMNDYSYIRWRYGKLYPSQIADVHDEQYRFLTTYMDQGSIVMTHHAPSWLSSDKKYINEPVTHAYCNSEDDLINRVKPALWVHGHCHNPSDYMIGETRVICNPYGYYKDRNILYNPTLVVEL